jgi:hypothetical protein
MQEELTVTYTVKAINRMNDLGKFSYWLINIARLILHQIVFKVLRLKPTCIYWWVY